MPHVAKDIGQNLRDRIALARVVCVMSMVYVHVPTGQSERLFSTLQSGDFAELIRGLLVEGPGRAGACLLGIVSGYLAAQTLLSPQRSLLALYQKRFYSMVVPMFFWSLLTFTVYTLVSETRTTFLDSTVGLMEHVNILLFVTAMPDGPTLHLGYMRDLFVCVLLSPLLLVGLQRSAAVLLLSLTVLYLFVHGQETILILRPLVLLAFTFGLYLAWTGVALHTLDRFSKLWVCLALLASLLILAVNGGFMSSVLQYSESLGLDFRESVLYPLSRLFGSLAIWTCLSLAMNTRWCQLALQMSPYLFTAYCSHFLLLTIVYYAIWQPVFGSEIGGLFTVWFLSAPFLSMLMAGVFVKATAVVLPGVAEMLTGGRFESAPNKQAKPWLTARAVRPMAARRRQGIAVMMFIAAQRLADGAARIGRYSMSGLLERRKFVAGRR